jgi:hypothetical protein
MSDSPFADNFVSTPTHGQFQQQAVLPIEQEVDIRALRERDEQLRELEVIFIKIFIFKIIIVFRLILLKLMNYLKMLQNLFMNRVVLLVSLFS